MPNTPATPNIFRIVNARLSFAASIDQPANLDVTADITELNVVRSLTKHGMIFVIKFTTNKFTFIPPQSMIVIQMIDELNKDSGMFGFIGILSGASGLLPVNVGHTKFPFIEVVPIEASFVDLWSVLSTSDTIESSFVDSKMSDCTEKIKSDLSSINADIDILKEGFDKLNVEISIPHNNATYENIFIPGLTYLEACKSLQRNYGIYKNSLLMYSESSLPNINKAGRNTLITNIEDIVTQKTKKGIFVSIGEILEPGTKQNIYVVYEGSVHWTMNAVDSLSSPSRMQYQFGNDEVFWNKTSEIHSDGEELGLDLNYQMRIKKTGNEFAPANTQISLLSRLDQTIPWLTLKFNLNRWNWDDFRPGNYVGVKYSETMQKYDSVVINGGWCLSQNEISFKVEFGVATLIKNEVYLIKHFTESTIEPKTSKTFTANKS